MHIAKLVQSITVSVMNQLKLKQNMNWQTTQPPSSEFYGQILPAAYACLMLNFIYLSIYFKYLYVSIYLLAVGLVSIFVWELKKAATTGSYKLIKFCKFYWSEKFFVLLL